MRHGLRGVITSVGFTSGDRFVVGTWDEGPLGPMDDVMWAQPDGTRVLLAPSEAVADFITAVYRFDQVRIVDVTTRRTSTSLRVTAGPVRLDVNAGRAWPLPLGGLRRPGFNRFVENPIAKVTMKVSTYGVTATGVREWYRADSVRRVVAATASVDGNDCGALTSVSPLGVGISEPPRFPSMVHVRPLLEEPTGHLDAVITRGRDTIGL